MSRPFDGILVISIEQAIAAPYCTRQLADHGARVIKVERPDGGDFARAYDTRARGLSSHFAWINRSKESLVLDLKAPESVAALKLLIARADVFIQNLAPGAAGRLGLGTAELRAAYPRLVTCDISGYGTGGSWDKRKAYDLLIQAEAGFLSVTGTPDEAVKAGISVADIAAGSSAYQSILAALFHRERTGRGDHIEVSMLEAMAEWMGYPLYYATDGAPPPTRTGAGHASIFPYGPYETADGTVLFGLQNDREWTAFATVVLERPDLAEDARFKGNPARAENRAALDAAIAARFSSLTTGQAVSKLEEAEIATARVNDMAAVWDHPQLRARRRWQDIATPVGLLPALKPISGEGWEPRMDAIPALGEHTAAILREIGLDDGSIARLGCGGAE